jgi:transcriptional regulator with XRE-family HTH domain
MENILFWPRVRQLLKAKKVSYEKFAKYIGVTINTFNGWQYNNRIPDAVSACDIALGLGVTVEYLVFGNNEKETVKKTQQRTERKIAVAKIKTLLRQIEEETEHIR